MFKSPYTRYKHTSRTPLHSTRIPRLALPTLLPRLSLNVPIPQKRSRFLNRSIQIPISTLRITVPALVINAKRIQRERDVVVWDIVLLLAILLIQACLRQGSVWENGERRQR